MSLFNGFKYFTFAAWIQDALVRTQGRPGAPPNLRGSMHREMLDKLMKNDADITLGDFFSACWTVEEDPFETLRMVSDKNGWFPFPPDL